MQICSSKIAAVLIALALGCGVVIVTCFPLSECFVCKGKGRFIWKEAEDIVLIPAYKGEHHTTLEQKQRRPAVTSKCLSCYGTGKLSGYKKVWLKTRKQIVQDPSELREEGETFNYFPDIHTPDR